MNVRRFLLRNGLTVLISTRPKLLTSVVAMGIKHGSLYENWEKNGLSHFLEHMLLKGTQTRSCIQLLKEIETIGGVVNAETSRDHVLLFLQVPAKELYHGLDIVREMIFYPAFSTKEFLKEKESIQCEIASEHDDPLIHTEQLFLNALYEHHPVKMPLTGTHDSVAQLTEEDLIQAHEKYYVPNNMVLCILGDVRIDEVSTKLNRIFCDKESKSVIPLRLCDETNRPFKNLIVERRQGIAQAKIITGVKTVPVRHQDSYALRLLTLILGGGVSSRLNIELREKRGLVYSAYGGHFQGRDYGYLCMYCDAETSKIKKIRKIMWKQLERMKKEKTDNKELKKAQNMIKGIFARTMDDPEIASRFLVDFEIKQGCANKVGLYFANFDKVSSDDISTVANRYLLEGNFATAILQPSGN